GLGRPRMETAPSGVKESIVKLPARIGMLCLAGAALALLTVPAQAKCPGPMTWLQQRVVTKHAQGTDELRRYIFITRSMYQLDMADTVAWIEERKQSEATCRAAVASAEPTVAQAQPAPAKQRTAKVAKVSKTKSSKTTT